MHSDPLMAQAEAADSDAALPSNPCGRLYAISDLHLSYKSNREALEELAPHPNDCLIICGDVGETSEHLRLAFSTATACFEKVFWTPGNHELYTMPSQQDGARGEGKYKECVEVAREYGVLTPEDPYARWHGEGGPCLIAPIFTLYDYSFRPDDVTLEDAVNWAKEEGVEATDEVLLHPDPYTSRIEWCEALVAQTETKLADAVAQNPDAKLVIAGHWPLRQDVVKLMLVPRFSIWCGTKQTDDWHTRFNAKVVVSGHLHVRRTDWRDETRFEECSLGYPKQWKECKDSGMDINDFLREILPGPGVPTGDKLATIWRRYG